ncbi:brassinosteroid-insensitive4, MIDGET [Hibiscus trionum]|uniref:Brassinosteroid-insensitive4, MIDGET n=1 Tax=Hibiscus trionum TaxID=183268 RepID=A0A9W7HGK4_HIBTR|nr:brassinosteroid-insensitive4, MIDGET [Hibiscus trionum]
MNRSREDSPDWLRSFQAPTSNLVLSSDSDSLPNGSPVREDNTNDEGTILRNNDKVDQTPSKKKKTRVFKKHQGSEEDGKVSVEEMSEKGLGSHAANHSIWTLSSDSESSPKRKEKGSLSQESGETSDLVLTGRGGKSPRKKTSKGISPKKRVKTGGQTPTKVKDVKDDAKVTENDGNVETAEEAASEKHIEPHVSTSRLPLVLSEKVQRSKALVECEGDSIDLSGDMGAVGRIVVSGSASENHEMFLDLKGTIYKTTIVPSRTFCIVSFGQTEAKIEAIMNDFIQLKPQSNVYEAETMVEGTLEGFSFDSEDEAEKMPKAIPHQADQNEEIDGQMNGKSKGRAEKTSMASRKRGKTVGGKSQQAKKARKKTAVSKKPKAKK